MITLALLALLQQDANAALEKFKTAYKAKEAAARAEAVTELARTDHDKVVAKLALLLIVDDEKVRIAAVQGLGAPRESRENLKKAATALVKGFGPNAATGQKAVCIAIYEALEKIGEGVGLACIHQYLTHPTIPVAEGAIDAAGSVGKRASIPILIKLVKALEAAARQATNVGPGGRSVTGGGLIPGTDVPVDADAPKRQKSLTPVAFRALEALSGQSFKTVREWETWWEEKGKIQTDK